MNYIIIIHIMSNFSNFNNAFNQNSPQTDYNYNSFLIKPPERNKTHGTITRTLVIDSRDRNYTKYPDSNKFRLEILEEYKDITSLELIHGSIPNTYYNINNNNNKFYISEDNKIYCIEIPIGKYTNENFINILNGEKGNLFNELYNKYHFHRDENNLKFRIQSNCDNNNDFIYNINYQKDNEISTCNIKSVDKIIGFGTQTYISRIINLSHIYVEKNNIIYQNKISENDYKIFKITAKSITNDLLDFRDIFIKGDYLILNAANFKYSCRIYNVFNDKTIEIESLDNNNPIALFGQIFNNISILYSPNTFNIENKSYVILKIAEAKVLTSNNAANNAYSIIPLNDNKSTIINQSTLPSNGIIKYFNPPLGKLFWLDIEFLNYDGTLFDFKGQENLLIFSVGLLNQPGRYNNIIDRI